MPVDSLIDYLEAVDSLEEFLDDFPSVSREAAITALEDPDQSEMKVLLDENQPRKLAGYLVGHGCRTVVVSGWSVRKKLAPRHGRVSNCFVANARVSGTVIAALPGF